MFTKYVNEKTIRSMGPAVVIVLELEAPARFFSLASTEAEFEHLLRWLSTDERAGEIMATYFQYEHDDEQFRAEMHERLLDEGERLELGERVLA